MTFLELAEKTLEKAEKPLSPKEIWDFAKELKIANEFHTRGKTPWATIGARIYTDIRDNEDSVFIQVSKRPTKFYLKRLGIDVMKLKQDIEKRERDMEKSLTFKERDLHPLLVKFVNSHMHFKAFSKTIFHENSKRGVKGYNKWLHPDVVGVYFPFEDYLNNILEIQKAFSVSALKLFSFEIKISISFSKLREYYFQAISNSSWANEGYLVALRIEDDSSLYDEMRRLNNAFGIGIIRLNPEDIYQSEILFPAKENTNVDWDTINRLAEENEDFKEFISYILEDITLKKVKSNYEKILEDEELEKHINAKNIK
ncbi:MAG: HTH domain-containing protein [Deferribacterota bacterium]|nr:HTH domain-containing protein [Deferribacterota bacterium]